jgi:hypothetical protein
LAPRHPPRALCSLTSLSNSPIGKCKARIGIRHLVRFHSAEIEVQKTFDFRSRLHLERFWPEGPARRQKPIRIQRSAGRWPRGGSSSSRIRGARRGRHTSTARGTSSRRTTAVEPARVSGVYPIFNWSSMRRCSWIVLLAGLRLAWQEWWRRGDSNS